MGELAPLMARKSTQRRPLSDAAFLRRLATLSVAQAQVCRLLLTDRTEMEIARRLRRPFNTVHSQAKQVYLKLGVDSRYGLLVPFLDRAKVKRLLG